MGEGELAFGRGLVIRREKRGLVMGEGDEVKSYGYLECWVYEMSESEKRIWRWVRVNRHSAEAW